ncbi:branched-chain amino acid transaminase [Leptonema illini]|uniref:Branched-chain-amino-acid aminotransferase n=1 Tax=Leptonema illini DSM 21528 TaxID=929563 RepID=H2CAS5_9LEPT|nr:branched-chain amino acid transaminase [Leptonema illini]EHQ08453.1 branched chain amino acid aminotransferase apoenzyme [Leptonema illini DSM 21528]
MEDQLNSVAYHLGEFRPLRECNINIMTHALQYGTMVFGGMRGYHDAETNNVFLFRPYDHFRRLHRSSRIMQMQPSLTPEQMADIALELVRRNEYRCNVYFRPFIYKSELKLSPRLHDVADSFSIYTMKLDDYIDTSRGLNVAVSSWRRIDDNVIPTRAKVAGGYANSALAKSEAVQNGFDEAIFLDSRGFISEGSAENLFVVRDGVLITPPNSASILEGITMRTIIELAKDEGIEVIRRDIGRSELYIADEVFFTGTGAQVAWVAQIDRRLIADGAIGPITQRLRDRYMQLVRGRDTKFKDWAVPVYAS